jgi:hypothetical protein
LLAIHEVANEDEEYNEDVEVHKWGEEEVVRKEQKRLSTVSAFDGADDACGFDSACCIGRPFEPDGFGESHGA